MCGQHCRDGASTAARAIDVIVYYDDIPLRSALLGARPSAKGWPTVPACRSRIFHTARRAAFQHGDFFATVTKKTIIGKCYY